MALLCRSATKMNGLAQVLKHCPKCGAAAFKQMSLKMFRCSECGFELYINNAASVAALIPDGQGRLLITTRAKEPKKGAWDLPGGFVDPDESAETAIKREIQEELGLEVVSTKYLCSLPNRYEYMGVRYPTMDLGFVCQVADFSSLAVEQVEIAQVSFVPVGEVDLTRFGFASIAGMVERYQASLT
jgi:NAD+ diphosphatase